MPINFYRRNGNFYNAQTNAYIGSTAFGNGSNYREVNAPTNPSPTPQSTPPTGSVAINGAQYNTTQSQQASFSNIQPIGNTLYGVPRINNNINSNDIQTGMNNGNIGSQLPPSTALTIQEVEAQNAKKFSQGANDMLSIFRQQQKEAEAKIKEAEARLAELNIQQKEQVTDKFDELSSPFRKTMEDEGNRKYQLEEKYTKYSELANSLVTLSDIAYNDILTEKNRPALQSISTGRTNAIKEDYNSKIALTKTAMSALSDDIAMGRTFIDRGIEAVIADRKDRLNYLEFVNGLFSEQKTDAKIEFFH